MQKLLLIIAITLISTFNCCFAQDSTTKTASNLDFLSSIKFVKSAEIPDEIKIRNLFENYIKYTNSQKLDKFMNLHDDSYRSCDGYDKERLKELAIESWKEYPKVKYSMKILSVNVNLDNATVIVTERLTGETNSSVDFVKDTGFIDSESTSIYYLKKFSNEWRITSDFVVNEKTSMRFGVAKFIPMQLDAPALIPPQTEYTAILKANIPRKYVALISLNNEPITFPQQKSQEIFRGLKSNSIKERILISNNKDKNENAIASVGIAEAKIIDENINISLLGIAFLSSRVNVINQKISTTADNNTISIEENRQ